MKKGDKIAGLFIISLIIISSLSVFLYKQHIKSYHHSAIIKQDGKVIKTIDLNNVKKDEKFNITYKNHFNTIEIAPGKIRISEADCPDKICVKTGWISEPGTSAVCLPHKLIISIEGKNSKIDGITN